MPKNATKAAPKKTATKVEVGELKNLPSVAPFAMPPIAFSVTDTVIAKIREDVATLPKIEGPQDKKNYQIVKTARLNIVRLRNDMERERKEKKAGALEYGRQLDAEAKKLTAILEEIEKPLHDQEKEIDAYHEAEAARIQKIKDDKAKERETALADVGVTLSITEAPHVLYSMSDEDFASKLEDATFIYNVQKEREAEEQAELERLRAEEAERQEQARKEQEAEAARVAEARQKLEKERAEFEDQQRKAREELEAQQREQQAAREREEAVARARREETERLQREAEQKERAEQERRDREEREAAARPDKEKIDDYIAKLRAIPIPVLDTEEAKATLAQFHAALREAVLKIG